MLYWILAVTQILAAVGNITLDQAFNAALDKNEIVKQGNEQLDQAASRIDQLKGGIFPSLTFNVLYTVQPSPSNSVASQFSPPQQTTANFTINQPLFRGLREFNGLGQLNYLRDAQEKSYEATILRLYQDVVGAFLQILNLEQDLRNLREQQILYENRVSELGARAKRGESNRSDVISASSTLSSLTAEIRLVEGQREVARENFLFLTGLPRESELVDPNLMKGSTLQPLETYMSRVDERPDVKAMLAKLEAARKAVTVSWGGHSPSLDAYGNYYIARPGFLSDLTWDVGLRLTVPIFEGGSTQAKVSEAVSKQKESELDFERARRAARQEIRSLYERVKARVDHLTSLEKSAELTKQNTTLMQQDYRRGLARNIDVQTAFTEYRIAQRSFDQAYFSAQLEMIQLQAAAAIVKTPPKENRK